MKEEATNRVAPNAQPVLEEFIPLKKKDCEENHEQPNNNNINKNEKDSRDKKNWMSSVQLWNTDDLPSSDLKQNSKTQTKVHKTQNSDKYL